VWHKKINDPEVLLSGYQFYKGWLAFVGLHAGFATVRLTF